jgi:hypothetical protein
MNRLTLLPALFFLVNATAVNADPQESKDGFSVVGSYGFDWLNPSHAKCAKITPKLYKKFQSCEYRAAGGFGVKAKTYTCTINEDSEYMVYENVGMCRTQLGTMKANAP